MPTARDRVWRAALDVGMHSDTFTVDDVVDELDEDGPSRKTVQRTLRGMTDLDVLEHGIGSPRYTCIWSAVYETTGAPDPGDQEHLPDPEEFDDTPPAPEPSIEDVLDELEPPGYDPEDVEARRGAVRAAVEALQAKGELTKSELLEAVDEEVGTAGYGDLGSLWQNWLYGALHDLDERGFAESPGATRRGWRLR